VIALDTNLLVYAHRRGTGEHEAAKRAIEEACGSRGGCGVAEQALAEFWCVVTHPSSQGGPSSPALASRFLRALEDDGGLQVFTPGPGFAGRLVQTAVDLDVRGARIFDLQIALCALDGGATELWTCDERFVKVPGLRVRNPLR
jgi:toxin-antitoxin system PIN domain toxin